MTTIAWVFMLLAWSIIIGCTLYCFVKLLTANTHVASESTENEDGAAN